MKKVSLLVSFLFLILLTISFAQAQEDLTQTYTASDGSFSIMYPAGWKADDSYISAGFTQFSSGPTIALNQVMETLKSGDMGVALFLTPNSFLDAMSITGDNIGESVGKLSTGLGHPNPKVEDLTVGTFTAARVVTNAFDKDEEIIGVDLGSGQQAIALGITFKGESAKLDATIQAMLESIQVPASGSPSSNATEAAVSATAEAIEPSATVEATEELPPLVTSTSGEYIVSARLPDNWSVQSYPSTGKAELGLLEEAPNHLTGQIDFPATSRGGNSPHEIATFPTSYVKGTVTDIEINGRPAARLDGISSDNTVLYIVVTTSKGDFVQVSFGGPADAMAEEEETMLAIAASIKTGDPNAVDTAAPVPTATATALQNAAPTAAADTNTASACTVTASKGANLRSGPGTTFDRAGALAAGASQSVIGQANGSDGFVWWKLESSSWVRSDLVQTDGDCTTVPTVAS